LAHRQIGLAPETRGPANADVLLFGHSFYPGNTRGTRLLHTHSATTLLSADRDGIAVKVRQAPWHIAARNAAGI
jgi:hypothetical protein